MQGPDASEVLSVPDELTSMSTVAERDHARRDQRSIVVPVTVLAGVADQLASRLSASCDGAGFGGVGEHALAAVGGELHRFVGELEVADDGVVERLVPVSWKRTLWAAQRTRNASLWVESSPMRSESRGRRGRGRLRSGGSRRRRWRRGPSRRRTPPRGGRGT